MTHTRTQPFIVKDFGSNRSPKSYDVHIWKKVEEFEKDNRPHKSLTEMNRTRLGSTIILEFTFQPQLSAGYSSCTDSGVVQTESICLHVHG